MKNSNLTKLTDNKSLKEEMKEYDALIHFKPSKYGALAEMKQQIFSGISTYDDEELDLFHEFIKAKMLRSDKAISAYMPVWAAIAIALLTVACTSLIHPVVAGVILTITLIIFLFMATHESNKIIIKLQFYSMVLGLVEKECENRGHTFNDTLTKQIDIDEVTQ